MTITDTVQGKLGGVSRTYRVMVKSFTIRDNLGRTWGYFEVASRKHGKIHGYLKPNKDFEFVRNVFTEHEETFLDPDADTDETSRRIVSLGAYLIDNQSGQHININGIIFISKSMLVTCELEKQ